MCGLYEKVKKRDESEQWSLAADIVVPTLVIYMYVCIIDICSLKGS